MTNPTSNNLLNHLANQPQTLGMGSNSLVSLVLESIGIEANDAESQKAMVRGGTLVAAAANIPNLPIKMPSWVPPSLVLLGIGVAARPAINRYFSSTAQTPPSPEVTPPPPEPKAPHIPLVSTGETPKKINYSTNISATIQDVPNTSEELQELSKTQFELQSALLNIGGTPLYIQLAQTAPETERGSSLNSQEILQRSKQAQTTVACALNEISHYINNMEPILKAQLSLSSITKNTNKELLNITDNNEINKKETKKLINKVTRSITELEQSITSLSTDIQTTVPAFDYRALNLTETEKMIRNLDERIRAVNSLNELKETYKTALDAIQSLCNLKDAAEDLNNTPTTEKLKSTISALKTVSDAIESLEKIPNSPLSVDWLKDVTSDYTKLILDHLTAATITTGNELNTLINLSRNTDIPNSRLQFLTKLKDKINTTSLIGDDLKNEFSNLERNLLLLKTSIATKKSWQPTKNAVLLGLSSLAITAAITGGKLACDVAVAIWNKK